MQLTIYYNILVEKEYLKLKLNYLVRSIEYIFSLIIYLRSGNKD